MKYFSKLNLSQQLGLARIIYFFILLIKIDFNFLYSYSQTQLRVENCTIQYGIWYALKLSPAIAIAVMGLAAISFFTSMLGLFKKISYWVAFFSFTILYSMQFAACYWNHGYLIHILTLFFWALLDNQSTLSLDDLVGEVKVSTNTNRIKLILGINRAHLCIVFFNAGISKLRNAGFDWISDFNLRNYLILQNYADGANGNPFFLKSFNFFLISNPNLCKYLSIVILTIELLALVPIFFSKSRYFFGVAFFLMQISFYYIFYIDFFSWLGLYSFWLIKQDFSSREN